MPVSTVRMRPNDSSCRPDRAAPPLDEARSPRRPSHDEATGISDRTLRNMNGPKDIVGISVLGHGEVTGPPDLGIVTIGVDCRGETVAAASTDANRAASALVDSIRRNKVAERDIQTSRLTIYPDYDHAAGVQRVIGYRATTTQVVLIRDLDHLAAVIDSAVGAGGDSTVLEGVRFAVVDDAARLDEARARAWADAQRKAEQLAELAGLEVGELIGVEERAFAEPFVGARFSVDASMAPVVAPGELCSTVDLAARFAIKGREGKSGWGFSATS